MADQSNTHQQQAEEIAALKQRIRELEALETECKRAKESLRESEEKYRLVMDNIADVITVVDLNLRFTYVSPSIVRLRGYTAEEVMGQTMEQALTPESLQIVARILEEELKLEASGTADPDRIRIMELEEYRKDGSIVWIDNSLSFMRDETGKPVGIISLSRNITARKQAEEALRESTEKQKLERDRLELILKTAQDGFWLVNASTGHLDDVNKAASSMLGYTRKELLASGLNDIDVQWSPEEIGRKMQKIKTVGNALFETRHRTKDGQIIDVEISVNYLPATDQFFSFIRNITERKQGEEDLQKAKEIAEKANRSKSEFLANMSHEIRTPMNGIIGMTELALDTDLTKDQREYLEMVRLSADSLLSLINDILDFSKIEAKKLELEEIDFDLGNTLENTVDILAIRAREKGLELTCHIMPEIPTPLVGDPGRLRQVLINLAGNATKFTEKGEIGIKAELLKNDPQTVALKFSVKDTGIGIPQDKVGMIFDNFSQVDGSVIRKYGGTGLGLSISRELVHMMGGDIGVESRVGEGSTFHFTARFKKGISKPAESAQSPLVDIAGTKVLIVDDNATNRQILREMTAQWGLAPTEAADGPEALALMEEASQAGRPYGLVLLDLEMPGMDGFSVAKTIKNSAFGRQAKIIMLTSMGQKGDAAYCREIGISGYLLKPVKKAELLDAIKIALGRTDVREPEDVVTRYTVQEAHRRFNILVAEDNLINQKLALSLLQNRGHKVVLAHNGKEAVEAFQKGDIDLILMDVQMPEMDGFEATREIRELETRNSKPGDKAPERQPSSIKYPVSGHIPIVAMTAHAMEGDRERCLAAGMDGYISKPIKAATLFEVIEKMMGRSPADGDKNRSQLQEGEKTPSSAIFDFEAAMEVVVGNKELFHEIGNLFIDTLPEYLNDIKNGIEKGDAHAVERAAHSLKGSVGNFGARRSHEAALKLEKLGERGDLEAMPEALTLLEEELGLLVNEMNRVLSEEEK